MKKALWFLMHLPFICCFTFLKWRWKVCFVATGDVTELYGGLHWNRCWNDWLQYPCLVDDEYTG